MVTAGTAIPTTEGASIVTTERITDKGEPRAMLALITLAELPIPKGVTFYGDSGILSMDFDNVADGQVWSSYLGGRTDTYVSNGTVFLSEGVIRWRGWSVQLHANEDHTPNGELDDDTTARLQTVAASATGDTR